MLWMHGDQGRPGAEAKGAPASRITWLPDPPKGCCSALRALASQVQNGKAWLLQVGRVDSAVLGDPKNPGITAEVKLAKASSFPCSP